MYVLQNLGSCAMVWKTVRTPIRTETPSSLRPSSTVMKTSPRPKSPMTATMKLKPPISSVLPKVRRSLPVTMSIPTAAMMKPRRVLTTDFTGDIPPKDTKALKVNIMTAKVSGGPNINVNSATMGAAKVRISVATMAPKKWEQKAVVRASQALPFLAMGYPSKQVATDHGSPGMLNRIEVITPPKSAPQ